MNSQDLIKKRDGLLAQATALQDKAKNEARDLTEQELESINGALDACDKLAAQIKTAQRLEAAAAVADAPAARKVVPDGATDVTAPPRAGATTVTGGAPNGAKAGLGDFRSFGEYAMAVKNARITGNIDKRLTVLNAATTYGSEGVGADGGYLVPPDIRTQIMVKVAGEESLLQYCDTLNSESNAVTLPTDENTPWDTTNGVQVYWAAEAATATQSKLQLKGVTVKAEKLIALVPVTDELLQDAPMLDAYLRNKAPQKIGWKVNDAILNGDGVGKPTGLLKSAALVTQAAEGGQTAGTVNFSNVTKMWQRMPNANRKNGVWITQQDIEPQLMAMVVPGGSPALPAYLPPGGLADRPYGTLFGRPVIYTEAAAAIGTVGDITFADLTQYFALVKGGGVKTDVSIHLYFDQDATAYRFVLRIGGVPWWQSSITRAKGGNTLSAYVSLAAR